MAQVDPRLYQVPAEFQSNPHTRKYFEDLERFLHDLWFRTGGGDDEISNQATRESYAWNLQQDDTETNASKISALYSPESEQVTPFLYQVESVAKEFRCFTVNGGTYTALDHDYINGKSNTLIYFPENPPINATFTTRNGDGSTISLNGNGKMLNGCSTGIIDEEETSIDWYYFLDSDEWFSK